MPSALRWTLVCLLVAAGCGESGRTIVPNNFVSNAKDADPVVDDAGNAVADSGATADGGVNQPSDGGATATDSGVTNPPGDTGVNPPFDSGTVVPPADAGGPPSDSGVVVPPADGGVVTPPTDAGTNAGTVPIGAACADNSACNVAAGGLCLSQAQFPDGYCTSECGNTTCPTGASCWGIGLTNPVCLDNCVSNTDCRNGYICDGDNTCWPGTAAGGTTPVGGPCTSNADCRDTGAQCITQAGWPGGYCYVPGCDAQNPCPGGSTCYMLQGGSTACFDACTAPSQCRTPDYTCDQNGCFPGCGATGCDPGETCNMATGACQAMACTPGSCGAGLVCDTASGACVVNVGNAPAGPIPSCPNIPDWRCTSGCGDLVPFTPVMGPGYDNYPLNGETAADQYRSFIRRDVRMLIKHAAAAVDCLAANWTVGNGHALGLGDMSEANGDIPGTRIGQPGHPPGTHVNGTDMDIAYYQLRGANNYLRAVCNHTSGGSDQYHCVSPPDNVDVWRTALFLAKMHETSGLRIIGVDGQIGPLVESALTQLCARGWVTNSACTNFKVTYETTDMMRGWYRFHHHHFHISVSSSGTFAPIDPSRECLTQGCRSTEPHDLLYTPVVAGPDHLFKRRR